MQEKKKQTGFILVVSDPFFCLPKHTCIENHSSNTDSPRESGEKKFVDKSIQFFYAKIVKQELTFKYVVYRRIQN